MIKFNIGDKVKVTNPARGTYGMEGDIIALEVSGWIEVKFSSINEAWSYESDEIERIVTNEEV